jgi:hypothetical protein
MGRVISIHEYELRRGVRAADFERALADAGSAPPSPAPPTSKHRPRG